MKFCCVLLCSLTCLLSSAEQENLFASIAKMEQRISHLEAQAKYIKQKLQRKSFTKSTKPFLLALAKIRSTSHTTEGLSTFFNKIEKLVDKNFSESKSINNHRHYDRPFEVKSAIVKKVLALNDKFDKALLAKTTSYHLISEEFEQARRLRFGEEKKAIVLEVLESKPAPSFLASLIQFRNWEKDALPYFLRGQRVESTKRKKREERYMTSSEKDLAWEVLFAPLGNAAFDSYLNKSLFAPVHHRSYRELSTTSSSYTGTKNYYDYFLLLCDMRLPLEKLKSYQAMYENMRVFFNLEERKVILKLMRAKVGEKEALLELFEEYEQLKILNPKLKFDYLQKHLHSLLYQADKDLIKWAKINKTRLVYSEDLLKWKVP